MKITNDHLRLLIYISAVVMYMSITFLTCKTKFWKNLQVDLHGVCVCFLMCRVPNEIG